MTTQAERKKRMPKYLREVYEMHYEQGKNKNEICKIAGLSFNTVRTYVADARRLMQMQPQTTFNNFRK